ncbi:MAG: succinate dehydrogenase, cytochrome b556 subunit [Zoogloeaceae bacterium]|nr:succinate dehydrogenase, cytochrome b556 subunit [Zoogloeaceae bacterium]
MRSPTGGAPKFLNLFHIRFPIGAMASIGHRISGVLLLIGLPLLALTLERSLSSEVAFESLWPAVASPWWGLLLVILVWAAAQHVLAGVRHLLMDIGIGSPLAQARTSAWAVILTAAIIALATAIRWLA